MADLRRDFHLPEEDQQFLDIENPKWEAVQDGGIRAVILYGFPFPGVFRPEAIDLKIKMPGDYTSGAALDMFFTNIRVTRSDGADIPRLTESAVFDGKKWWQWSRHYPEKCKWRPGVNSLVTHICHIQHLLEEEARGKVWA